MSPAHPDPAQSTPRLFIPGAAPEGAQPLLCTPKRVRVAREKFSVIPTADGSTNGATCAGEQVSRVNSPRRRDLLLLTLYSLSCPWMVSRCTRVHVRAMAVLFKTLILTSVGAALGSGRSGTKQSAVSTRCALLPTWASGCARRLCHLLAPLSAPGISSLGDVAVFSLLKIGFGGFPKAAGAGQLWAALL